MGFFDEENRVIMREFLDDADFYEDGDLDDDGLINLSHYDNNVADDLDAGDASGGVAAAEAKTGDFGTASDEDFDVPF